MQSPQHSFEAGPLVCHHCPCCQQSQELQTLRQVRIELEDAVGEARAEISALEERLTEVTTEKEIVEYSRDEHKEALKETIVRLVDLEQTVREKDQTIGNSLYQHKEALTAHIVHQAGLEQAVREKDQIIETQELLLALAWEDTHVLESSQKEKDGLISQLRDQVKGAHARKSSDEPAGHQLKRRRLSS